MKNVKKKCESNFSNIVALEIKFIFLIRFRCIFEKQSICLTVLTDNNQISIKIHFRISIRLNDDFIWNFWKNEISLECKSKHFV